MDGIEGLRSLPRHSVDMLLTDPPYGTTRNFWDVPLAAPGAVGGGEMGRQAGRRDPVFAQCPYDKVLGASNLSYARYEWVWYKSRSTGFLNARRAPLKKTENNLVFYQKLPLYNPQFEQASPTRKLRAITGTAPTTENLPVPAADRRTACAFPKRADLSSRPAHRPPHAEAGGPVRVFHQNLHPARRGGCGHLRGLCHNSGCRPQYGAAASSVLKPSPPTTPPPQSASVWRGQRWRPGRKECNYRDSIL